MRSNESTIRAFIAAWSRLDVEELVSYFTPDGTYHNMMTRPVSGHDNLRRFIGGFVRGWTRTDWEILNILAQGEVVIAERVDRTEVGGKKVELPCCGVFEMREGRIALWRDYFDMATYTKAVA